jgi:UDPglucose--hexose-1-phosphate uridylyltransferase
VLYCDIVYPGDHERVRVVAENAEAVAFAPYRARFPVRDVDPAARHAAAFDQATDAESRALPRCSATCSAALDRVVARSPFNMILHTAPFGGERARRITGTSRSCRPSTARRLRGGHRLPHQPEPPKRPRRA